MTVTSPAFLSCVNNQSASDELVTEDFFALLLKEAVSSAYFSLSSSVAAYWVHACAKEASSVTAAAMASAFVFAAARLAVSPAVSAVIVNER